MNTYKVKFTGVVIGAIGKPQTFTVTITADNWNEARLKLYESYEHVTIETVNGKKP